MSGIATKPGPAAVTKPARPISTPRADSGRAAPAWVAIGLVGAAFGALFFRWLYTQARISIDALDDWGHAFVIPFVSIYFIHLHWKQLRAARVSTFWPGLAPFVLGVVCYFFFVVGVPNHMLQGFSLVLAIAGAVLLLLGPAPFRYLFIPVSLLVFCVQVSPQIMDRITFQLQLVASKGAEFMLAILGGLSGFVVVREGNTLEVIRGSVSNKLNVAEACSGMRMVIAFIALAVIISLLQCRHWWQRAALLLLAVPVAVFLNIVRVTVLGLLSLLDMHLSQGSMHMVIGMLLLVPGLFLFLAIVWALNKAVMDEERAAAA